MASQPKFTQEQLNVIHHGDGHALVSAVAGSGKSTTMVERVAFLLRHGVEANRILVIQYNKTAQESMARKLEARLGGIKRPEARTFHSIGNAMRKRLVEVGALAPARLITGGARQTRYYRRALQEAWKRANGEGSYPPEEATSKFSEFVTLAKSDVVPPHQVFQDNGYTLEYIPFIRAFDVLRRQTLEDGVMFFDDMLYDPFIAMSADPSLWRHFAGTYEHLIVDEFQDANPVQFWLMMGVCGLIPFDIPGEDGQRHPAQPIRITQCMVVGDCDQSIYQFRGAKPSLINTEFEKSFEGAIRYPMTRTFRYGHQTALLANYIITKNEDGRDDKITIAAPGNPDTRVHMRFYQENGPTGIVKLLSKPHREERLHRAAMLVRFYSMSIPYELELIRAGIPYHVYGREPILFIPEIASLVGALFLATNHWTVEDEERDLFFRSMLLVPSLYLSTEHLDRLCEPMGNVSRAGGAVAQVIRQYADRQRQRDPRLASRLNERANTFQILESGALANAKPADILQAYLDSTGFSQQLVSMAVRGDNEELIRNVKAFMEMAKQFEKVHDLLDMLGPLAGKREDQPPEEDHLAILSVHRSKGEEWPTVILPGWTEGIFPRSKEGIEEERRLAYVAVTRAIQNLIFIQPEDPVFNDFVEQINAVPPSKAMGASQFLIEGEPGIAAAVTAAIRSGEPTRIESRHSALARRYLDSASIAHIDIQTSPALAGQLADDRAFKDRELLPGQRLIFNEAGKTEEFEVVRRWGGSNYEVRCPFRGHIRIMSLSDPGWDLKRA